MNKDDIRNEQKKCVGRISQRDKDGQPVEIEIRNIKCEKIGVACLLSQLNKSVG